MPRWRKRRRCLPCNLFVLPFPGLQRERYRIHLVDIPSSLHARGEELLQFRHRRQWVWDGLVLLNLGNNVGSLDAPAKVNELCPPDKVLVSVGDERKILQIDTCYVLAAIKHAPTLIYLPKNGTQGGLTMCSISRYSAKFMVAPMSLLSPSSVSCDLAGTCSHVLLKRWMEAVCSAARMAVRVEKLFSWRHLCIY